MPVPNVRSTVDFHSISLRKANIITININTTGTSYLNSEPPTTRIPEELHGGTSHINDYSTVIGNPNLQPYIQYDTQFNYILKQKYMATLYFQYGDKTTVQLPYQSSDALNLIYQTINMNYERLERHNHDKPNEQACQG